MKRAYKDNIIALVVALILPALYITSQFVDLEILFVVVYWFLMIISPIAIFFAMKELLNEDN
jgi:hypothetical protein